MKKKEKHVCPEHSHNISCEPCGNLWNVGYKNGVRDGRGSVKPTPYWYKVMIAIFAGLGLGYAVGWAYPDWKPIIEQPYAVYRPDEETTAKLKECQEEWRTDQIEKKLLRLKIKRMELPDGQ